MSHLNLFAAPRPFAVLSAARRDMIPIMLYEMRWLIPRRARVAVRRTLDRHKSAAAARLAPRIFELTGGTVASGPFEGMKYITTAVNSEICPKLLGTYEMELAPAIAQALDKPYDRVINIGAAEGYYAVGFARRLPLASVAAFESAESGRAALRQLAQRNGLGQRVEILGHCTPAALEIAMLAFERVLVICDAEGDEAELLDPAVAGSLQNADILVELHDGHRRGVSQMIWNRFARRGPIEVFRSRARLAADFPAGLPLADDEKLAAMWENRSWRQNWYWMSKR